MAITSLAFMLVAGTGTCLEHVRRVLVVQVAWQQFVAGLAGGHLIFFSSPPALMAGQGGGLFDKRQGFDHVLEVFLTNTPEMAKFSSWPRRSGPRSKPHPAVPFLLVNHARCAHPRSTAQARSGVHVSRGCDPPAAADTRGHPGPPSGTNTSGVACLKVSRLGFENLPDRGPLAGKRAGSVGFFSKKALSEVGAPGASTATRCVDPCSPRTMVTSPWRCQRRGQSALHGFVGASTLRVHRWSVGHWAEKILQILRDSTCFGMLCARI